MLYAEAKAVYNNEMNLEVLTMDGFGFIHEKLDIKILILYILRRLPAPIDAEELADLVLIDGGIGYFDYKECLAELEDNLQVEMQDGGYVATAKGARNCEIVESSLPYSVRMKAEKVTAPVAEAMRRSAMIRANHEAAPGGVTVYLSVSDGVGDILEMKILAASEEQAQHIEKNFKKNAESYYNRFIEQLSE